MSVGHDETESFDAAVHLDRYVVEEQVSRLAPSASAARLLSTGRPDGWPGVVGRAGERSSLAIYSYFRYDIPMTASKVSLSIDEDVLSEARDRAGRRELSSYVNAALRRQLQRDRLAELLTEMDAESGPIPEDMIEEARQPWRSRPASRRRRSA